MFDYRYNVITTDAHCFEATVVIRYLDLALTNTNISAFMLPDYYRNPDSKNLLKINLSPHQDILPPIGKNYPLTGWKRSWKCFIESIYRHSTEIEKTQIGEKWFNDPYGLTSQLNQYFPVELPLKDYQEQVKEALIQLIQERKETKHKEIGCALEKHLQRYLKENIHVKKIKIIAPFSAGDPAMRMMIENKSLRKHIKEVILVCPPDHIKLTNQIEEKTKNNEKLINIKLFLKQGSPYLYSSCYKDYAPLNCNDLNISLDRIYFKKEHCYNQCGRLLNTDLELITKTNLYKDKEQY